MGEASMVPLIKTRVRAIKRCPAGEPECRRTGVRGRTRRPGRRSMGSYGPWRLSRHPRSARSRSMGCRRGKRDVRGPGHSVQLGARDDGMHLPGRQLRVRPHVPVGGMRCRIVGLIRRPDAFAPPPVPSDEPVVPVPERVVEDDCTVPVRALPLGPPSHSYTTPAGPSFHHVARAMYAATAATATTIGETVPAFESVFGFNGEGIRCTPVIRFKYQSRIPVSWPAEA